jgi:hypothetical protein
MDMRSNHVQLVSPSAVERSDFKDREQAVFIYEQRQVMAMSLEIEAIDRVRGEEEMDYKVWAGGEEL